MAGWRILQLSAVTAVVVRSGQAGWCEGVGERVLSKEVTVWATSAQVWRAWTTSDGIADFFSLESKIGLWVGGPYELYFGMTEPDTSGKRGSEGCSVLSFLPFEMLSFEWNFPPKTPTLRSSGARTHVVLRFEDLGDGRVKVRFDQLGWGAEDDWDQGYAYFDKAWDRVLDRLKKHFQKTGDEKGLSTEAGGAGTPGRVLRKEVVVSASPDEVWEAWTTAEGITGFFAAQATVELAVGGKYELFFAPEAPEGSRGCEGCKVLSFVPREMLAVTWNAPPSIPTLRDAGERTQVVIQMMELEMAHVRVRVSQHGFGVGEDWDKYYAYFDQAWGNVLAALKGGFDG